MTLRYIALVHTPSLARQPSRAQHSTSTGAAQSHGGEKEKSQELAIPDLAFAFHHSSLPSIRAHSRPKPLCKAWPADAFFCLPPSLKQSRLLFSVITLKFPVLQNVVSARRSSLSQNSWHWHSNFPRAIETRKETQEDRPWNFPTHDHCRSPERRGTLLVRPSLSNKPTQHWQILSRFAKTSRWQPPGNRRQDQTSTTRPHSIYSY